MGNMSSLFTLIIYSGSQLGREPILGWVAESWSQKEFNI